MFKSTLKAADRAAADEIVPFLRQIAGGLDQGKPIQTAYADALEQTTFVKHLLGTPEKALPFSEGLIKAAKSSGIGMLLVFARQVQLNEKAGGDLKDAIRKLVKLAELQQYARKEYRREQRIKYGKVVLIGAVVAATVAARRRSG